MCKGLTASHPTCIQVSSERQEKWLHKLGGPDSHSPGSLGCNSHALDPQPEGCKSLEKVCPPVPS